MIKRRLTANLILLLAAVIWGFAFVAQRKGMDYIGPFLFNGIRFLMGAIFILPVALHFKKKNKISGPVFSTSEMTSGALLGLFLFLGASAQQIGITSTTAGNAGFITGLYVIFVPIISIIFRQKIPKIIWPAAMLSLAGLYLLSVQDNFTIFRGDVWVFAGAFLWAIHVLLIGLFTQKHEPVSLAFIQFIACGILSMAAALSFETIQAESIYLAWGPLLYGGIMSVGIAFTLQLVGQQNAHPATASLLLSSESLFAALGGWLILNETMTMKAMIGCAFILSGIILVQIFQQVKINKKKVIV
ncbi:MAG: EamA family transporter [Bacteroidetes bacterium HGW-Bacteroidetes-21]|jgi:drug/metabolite transporter (DMT)-like permease|nr:MAG: EamA family transporter [Bacteroidetes bacterium HGW-Bacteroidetes-21]